MKPFFRITSLVLGILFLIGAAFAWIDLLKYGDPLSDPGLKPAAGWLLTGLMFLALGFRGWRSHRNRRAETPQSKLTKPVP
jgi:uncharacterized membrane protein YciS (DUF1049 family)